MIKYFYPFVIRSSHSLIAAVLALFYDSAVFIFAVILVLVDYFLLGAVAMRTFSDGVTR